LTEDQIHKALCAHLADRPAPNMVWLHVPNEGKRSYKAAARLKKMGMRKGAADFIFIHGGRTFALELKAPKKNPTIEQMQFISDVNAAGGFACMAQGLDAAVRVLETWGLLRRAVNVPVLSTQTKLRVVG
jgi:hypothetical protein